MCPVITVLVCLDYIRLDAVVTGGFGFFGRSDKGIDLARLIC